MGDTALKQVIATGLVILALAGCGGPGATPAPPPTVEATLTAVEPTALPNPTPAPPTATPAPPPGVIQFQNPQKYSVEYVVTVRNRGFSLDKLLVYQPRPIAWDGQQDVSIDEVSPEPSAQGSDPVYGNGIFYWDVRSLPKPGESTPFKIRFSFTAFETSAQVDPDKVQPYDQNDPLYKLYTRPEDFIESDDPSIVKIADQVAAGETNPYRLARKFYDYVIDSAHYKLLGRGLLGARALVTTGEGECGDYAALFVALARAKGIPARPVVGYWAISGVEQTHVWAEFYLEDLGWVHVDPTLGQSRPGAPGKPEYYFGNMDNQRVILNKGYNIPLEPPGPDQYVAAFLQVPLWWYWGTSGDADSVSIERTSWKVSPVP
jgi:transglutaminase-like putative cysteine protease